MSPPVHFLFRRWRGVAHGSVLLLWLTAASRAALGTPAAESPPPAASSYPWQTDTWRQAGELLVDDALARLPPSRAAGSDAERRALAYSRGVLLLNAQPKLPGNIDEARTLLESVRQNRADDETGLNALYYLARLAQFHADPHDPARAAALYSELIARAPAYPLAQEAVSRLAALRLYEDISPEERRARFAEFAAAADRLQDAPARRDLHFVLADASLRLAGDQEGMLRHLLAAEDAGILRPQLAGDTLARVAVLARELGHRDIAIAHYRKFLAVFRRDARAYLLGEQLKSLEAEPPAAVPPAPPSSASALTPASAPSPTPVASNPAGVAASTPTPTP